jgi:hypothetical protein
MTSFSTAERIILPGDTVPDEFLVRRQLSYCIQCMEPHSSEEQSGRYCLTCGEHLVAARLCTRATGNELSVIQTGARLSLLRQTLIGIGTGNENSWGQNSDPEQIIELLGDDMRLAIERSLTEVQPGRRISNKFLETLGKISVDERRSILFNVSIRLILICPSYIYAPLPLLAAMLVWAKSAATNL